MKNNIFKIFALLMVLAMVVAPVSATPAAKGVGPDDLSPVDPSEITVKYFAPDGVEKAVKGVDGPARFIIQFEDAPLAVYDGSLNGLKATSPLVTGAAKLDVKSPESKAYLAHLDAKQVDAIKNIESVVKRDVNVLYQYQVGLNGIAVEMTAEELLAVVRDVPGIKSVEREQIHYLDTDVGPAFIGAPAIWNDSTDDTKGEDMLVGIIDSGINFDHPSFAEVGPVDGYVHVNPLGADTYLGVCDPTNTEQYDASYVCNDKLIGAYTYVTLSAYEVYSPEDSGGHGSHTASTVAGNVVEATMEKPTLDETQTISGVAPHANIIAYDVCYEDSGDGGCGGADINEAIEQAIADGVDVINFSISGGEDPYGESTEQLFLSATNAGIFVSTSAGNNGPDPETTGHRSPWLMSTAASTHNRAYPNGLIDMTGGDTAAPANIEGKGFTSGVGPLPIVYAGDFGNALCLGAEDSGAFDVGTDFTGQIVVCDRGTSARVRKAEVVAALGASGYVLANNAASADALVGDAYVIPGVHISYDDGVVLKAWMASGTGHTATVLGATRNTDASNGNIMADFSSRGPNGTIDILKPDVTAPGVDIWAAVNSPVPGVGNPEYDFYSGTSMSSPHTAGAATLLMALHPDWTPMEVKSALMLTAVNPGILKEDAATPGDVFDFGAGLIQVDLAAQAGLVMNETQANFLAANPADGGNPQDLNLASVYNSLCLSECSWTRTVKNVLDVEGSWTVSTTATDAVVTVTPSAFTLAAGATQELTITANVDAAEIGVWTFGDIQLVEDSSLAPDSHIPLAVNPSSGIIPELVTINTRRNAGSELLEGLQAIEITELTTETFGLVQAELEQFTLLEDPTYGDPYDDFDQVHISEFVVPEGAQRFVSEIIDTTSPDLDMFLLVDEGDGLYEFAMSATGTAYEKIDIMNPPAGEYYVIVQNYEASGVDVADDITLAVGVVTGEDMGNMTFDGPASVAKGELFDLRVYWDTPEMVAGDRWYGAFTLGSNSATPGDIGLVAVDVNRFADDVTKTVDMENAYKDDVVTFTLTVQPNVTGKDLIYMLEDTIPTGMELVPGSITGGAIFAGGKIRWADVMPGTPFYNITTDATDPLCDTGFGGYIDLEGFGIYPQAGIVGNDAVWTTFSAQNPFSFFGQEYTNVGFTDDGFLIFDGANNYGGSPSLPQVLPNPEKPNNLAAFLWQDMEIVYDGTLNKGVSIATAGTSMGIIEFDDIQVKDDPSQTFDLEAVIYSGVDDSPGAYEIVFAYDNIVGGMSGVTVGVENTTGSEAYTLVNAGNASATISDGTMICIDYVRPNEPHVITYQLKVITDQMMEVTSTLKHSVFQQGAKDVYIDTRLTLNTYIQILPLIFK